MFYLSSVEKNVNYSVDFLAGQAVFLLRNKKKLDKKYLLSLFTKLHYFKNKMFKSVLFETILIMNKMKKNTNTPTINEAFLVL